MQTEMTNDEARMTQGAPEGRSLSPRRRSLCPLRPCGERPFRPSSAVTLIEILVVIAIVTALAGAVIISAVALHNIGMDRGTTAFMERIALAQTQYQQTHRMYVPLRGASDPALDYNDIYQLRRSTMVLWIALERSGGFLAGEAAALSPGGVFTDPATGRSDTPWYFYLDRWNTPMMYQCDSPAKTYKLTSAGRDHIFGTGDDIVVER
jgi:type II secretory pathway pseudopilin PulG